MKRAAKPICGYNVFSSRTILAWRKCRMCNKEFRRERGWRLIGPPIFNGVATVFYLCGDCAPTNEDAERIAMERPWMGKQPNHTVMVRRDENE